MKAVRAGFFKELPHGDHDGQSLHSVLGSIPDAERESIAGYLRDGALVVACPGLAKDVLSSSCEFAGAPDVLTDGEWLWPGDLEYYVRTYGAGLPVEFLQRIRGLGYGCPKNVDVESVEL